MRVLSLSLRSRAWRRKIFVFCARAAFFAWAFHLLETESNLKETGCTNMRVCLSLCVQACIIYVYSAYVCVLFEHVHWFGGMWVHIWCLVFLSVHRTGVAGWVGFIKTSAEASGRLRYQTLHSM